MHSPGWRCGKPKLNSQHCPSCAKRSQLDTLMHLTCLFPCRIWAAIPAVLGWGWLTFILQVGSQGPQTPLDEGRQFSIFFISVVVPAMLKRTPESTYCTIRLQPRFQFGNVFTFKAHATAKIPKCSKMTADGFIHT